MHRPRGDSDANTPIARPRQSHRSWQTFKGSGNCAASCSPRLPQNRQPQKPSYRTASCSCDQPLALSCRSQGPEPTGSGTIMGRSWQHSGCCIMNVPASLSSHGSSLYSHEWQSGGFGEAPSLVQQHVGAWLLGCCLHMFVWSARWAPVHFT